MEEINNFIKTIMEKDLEEGRVKEIVTRFPPEPNAYLHIGHARAIVNDFELAKAFGGYTNLRFDDTNPVNEGAEYVDAIIADLKWLGYTPKNIYFGSDYFEGQISKIDLGWAKWLIASIALLVIVFFSIVPLISFALESLESTPGDISTFSWKFWFSRESVINDPYIETRFGTQSGVFHNKTILYAFGRSIIVSLIVALICGTFGILIGYAVSHNRRGRLSSYVSTVSFLPYLIPALSFGAVFFALIKTKTFSFLDVTTTGSELSAMGIVIIVGGVKFIPFASRSGTNAMLQLSGEIEEAAVIVGTPWWKRMTHIIFPIQKAS